MSAASDDPRQRRLAEVLSLSPVIPVVTLEDPAVAVPLARALLRGGLRVLEIVLRTAQAETAIRAVADEVPDLVLGAGTVLEPAQLARVDELGLDFAVSPGSSPGLLAAARDSRTPLLPGAVTASESMTLLEAGHVHQKLFPAEQSGGPALLDALRGPLPRVRFCPTGGIGESAVERYLACANVLCVGGSWVTPKDALIAGDWDRIEALARRAAAMSATR